MVKEHIEVLERTKNRWQEVLIEQEAWVKEYGESVLEDVENTKQTIKALSYAIDVLKRVDCIEASGIISAICLKTIQGITKNKPVEKIYEEAEERFQSYIKGE